MIRWAAATLRILERAKVLKRIKNKLNIRCIKRSLKSLKSLRSLLSLISGMESRSIRLQSCIQQRTNLNRMGASLMVLP